MAKVTCKFCGKVWKHPAEYLNMKDCDNVACPAMAMRGIRQTNNKMKEEEVRRPKHIKTQPEVTADAVRQVKIQTHYREVDVESIYDENEACLEVQVPKIIVINILKMGK